MVAPIILKILFWPAIAASIYYSAWIIIEGNSIGWLPLIIGTLFVRVVFEGMILFFSINDKLHQINTSLQNKG
jgi:hypothetical protein